ncbi:MAG: class II aldolase/adducin family protein, partial [Methylococcales bacterium]|nr:class II aldolase/adducin family protein [Methylococcales bacterium]
DLKYLQSAISKNNFSVNPRLKRESSLRPSIETLLHALMPHKIVVHLHSIEILAYLVRMNCIAEISILVGDVIRWAITGYHKPGAALAEAVYSALTATPDAQVVFLQNHGVVIGGNSVTEIDSILQILTTAFKSLPRITKKNNALSAKLPPILGVYMPVSDVMVHQLAVDEFLFDNLSINWALYPDHVVFLGSSPAIYKSVDEIKMQATDKVDLPELIFICGIGVFSKQEFSLTKQLQLRCYYDVISRQQKNNQLNSLNSLQVSELLNWEAEQYRMHEVNL